jgi:hypothetical protein
MYNSRAVTSAKSTLLVVIAGHQDNDQVSKLVGQRPDGHRAQSSPQERELFLSFSAYLNHGLETL